VKLQPDSPDFRAACAFITFRYLPWLAALNLVWEFAQLPLYSIWTEGTRADIAFALAHCTLGDVLIGIAALALSLMLTRARALADWRWDRIILLLVFLGTGYTVFSEWLNTTLLRWTYAESMPTLDLGGIEIGLSPLAQWLVVPSLALCLARKPRR
jgi:hypothetical protein